MPSAPATLLALALLGTFALGLNGALTAARATRLDVVGVIVLGMIAPLGGGFIRDILTDSLPPRPLSSLAVWSSTVWASSPFSVG